MKPLCLPLIGLVLLLALAPATRADVTMRISVKFILSPGGAMPCCGNGSFDSFADITNQVNFANEMLRSFGRGYQFQIFEVTTVGGPASAFYSNSRDDKDLLEAAAEADKPGFKYRDNAINMYVNDANGSAVCSFPPTDDIILYGQSSRTTSLWHESGHYFNLQHTHRSATEQNSNGSACTNGCSCARLIGGNNDFCDDTIADHDCWSDANDIAQGNYSANYSALSASRQALVDAVLNNIMSYHSDRFHLTSDQLDRWTDAANSSRIDDVSGRTRFVDRLNVSGIYAGTSTQPYRTVATGIAAATATGSDIVLIRPGSYNEPQTITKAVTLRATRGTAVLGK